MYNLNFFCLLSSHSGNARLIFLVFAFFFLINIASSGGHLDHWDGMEAFFVTESMVLKHTAKLDPSVPSVKENNFNATYTVYANKFLQTGMAPDINKTSLEPVYTVRSLLLSASAVPFYYSSLLLSIPPMDIVGLFVNSLFISLVCVVVFCFSLDLHGSKKVAFLLSVIIGVCSFLWPYNTTFHMQPLQALTLVSSAYFIYKSLHYNKSLICHYTVTRHGKGGFFAALGGFCLGLSVFSHATSALLIPAFVVYGVYSLRHNKKNLLLFLLVLGVVLLSLGFLNDIRFGGFMDFGYGHYGSLAAHDGWRGLVGLLLSPGSGLLFYFPVAILLPLGAKYMYKENRVLFLLFGSVITLNWLSVGTLSSDNEPAIWSGGPTWGPRYFIPVLPFIVLMLGNIFLHLRRKTFLKSIIVSLCALGFFVNLTGVLFWYHYGILYSWEIDQLHTKYPSDWFETMTWNQVYSPIITHTKALLSDYISSVDPEQYRTDQGYYYEWVAYGLAPCSYDTYLFCKYGIMPIMAISLSIAVITIFILAEIRVQFICKLVKKKPILLYNKAGKTMK